MRASPAVWILRASWLLLPFTAGDAISRALDGRSTAVTITASVISWLVWAVVMVATLVPHPTTLTVIRVLAPASTVVAIGALTWWAPSDVSGEHLALGIAGVALALVATALAESAMVADEYVNAASYGDERRFALRVPTSFAIGPVPVFWALLVGGCLGGPLLLAARSWILGLVATAIGVAVAVPAIKSFHGLSRRWLVFVPAGVTLVDHLGLVDPVLFPKPRIASLGPALEGTGATDLTQDALGLVIEIALDAPIEITARTSSDAGELQLVRGILVSPGRPGAVVAEAERRSISVATASTAS